MTSRDTVPETSSARLTALRDYWQSRCNGRRLPGRRDIDPVDLPRHLSTLLLIDDVGTGSGGRFRLVGTLLSRLMVRDPTRLTLCEVLDGPEMEAFDDLIGDIAVHRQPLAVYGHLVWASGWAAPVDWLFLPLAADGSTVDMIMGCVALPPLPVRLPAGRPRFSFSQSPAQAADGPAALRRWALSASLAAPVSPR